jgi:hypothetical protein
MGHPAVVLSLVLNGGFQIRSQYMAVITKTLTVTHVTDLPVHSRHFTVVLGEVKRMVIALIDNGFGFGLMTLGAHLVSRHLFGVLRRNCIPCAHSGTGEKKNQTDT